MRRIAHSAAPDTTPDTTGPGNPMRVHLPPRVLADFEGVWLFDRHVRHRAGDAAQVTGQATFRPVAEGLFCREEGLMRVNGGPPLTAASNQVWRAGLAVHFPDGRFFHRVPPRGGQATHWCDPDSYVVEYDFAAWPDWATHWTVRGPCKDYTMTTRYRPA